MSPTESPRHPALFRLYYGAVVLGAIALLVFVPRGLPQPSIAMLAGLFVLMLLGELAPVPLPGGGYVTASTIFNLPCVIFFGPFWTALLDLAANGIAHGVVRRQPPVRVLHNVAIYTLGYYATAWAYVAGGGDLGGLAFPHDGGALLLASVTHFAVNSACVSIVIGLTTGPNPWRVWQRNFQQGLPHHLSFLALGALVAVVYAGAGPWGIALFALPFLVSRYSFGVYL